MTGEVSVAEEKRVCLGVEVEGLKRSKEREGERVRERE